MKSHQNRRIMSIVRHFFLLSVLLICLAFNVGAQAQVFVAISPASIDPSKLQSVVVQLKKADGTVDAATTALVTLIKVGGQQVNFKKDVQNITFDSPALSPGRYRVDLYGKEVGQIIAAGQIEYAGSTWSSAESEDNRRNILLNDGWYKFVVIIIFLLLISSFVGAIIKALRTPKETSNQPLGLPTGSFRAIVAYTLIAYLGFYVLTSTLSISAFQPPEFLLGIVATVVGFYFGSRSSDESAVKQGTGTLRGTVVLGTSPSRGALVKLKRLSDNTEPYSRITDVEGHFELLQVMPGKYTVAASAGGKVSEDQQVFIADGSDHEITISIKETSDKPPGVGPVSAALGSIRGVVRRAGSNSVAAKAQVSLFQGRDVRTTEVNEDGTYKFDNIPAGEYELQAQLPGSNPGDKQKVKVESGTVAKDLQAP